MSAVAKERRNRTSAFSQGTSPSLAGQRLAGFLVGVTLTTTLGIALSTAGALAFVPVSSLGVEKQRRRVVGFRLDAASGKGRGSSTAASSGGGGFMKARELTYIPDDSNLTGRLVQALDQVGAVLDGTAIGWSRKLSCPGQRQGMRGLYATKNFKTNQVICKIPSAWVLALSDPNDSTATAVESSNEVSMAQLGANFLSMYYDTDPLTPKTQWSFYLDGMPQLAAKCHVEEGTPSSTGTLERTPDWFSTDEVALLEFPRCITLAQERQADIDRVAKTTGLHHDLLQWATTVVSSRSFALTMASSSEVAANDEDQSSSPQPQFDQRGQVITATGERQVLRVMVPYLDVVNHQSLPKANAQFTILDPELDDAWFALTANRPITAGTEITRSYDAASALSSVELLTDYGFVEVDNPMDAYMLRKGGGDTLRGLDDWTTTLQEDQDMLAALWNDEEESVETDTLRKILQFRIQLKQSYAK